MDAPVGADTGPADANRTDGSTPTIAPPRYPPSMTRTCAAPCADLRRQYADVVLRAQSCRPGAANPCGFKAPGSLGCNACEVWVSDLAEVAPLANQFNDMGCYGCYFGGADGQNRCHAVGCQDLLDAVCTMTASGQGTCTNQTERPCPEGVMTGTRCTRQPDQCKKGNGYCFCHASNPNWICL